MFGRGGPVRRERDGTFALRLSEEEQVVLKSLVAQLRTLLRLEGSGQLDEASGVRRLFPVAYPDDPDRQEEYRALVHDELLAARLAAIDEVEETITLPNVDEAQLATIMRTLNDLRLVLGTRLDVSEDDATDLIDPDDPDAPALMAYDFCGWLLEHTVRALATTLPED